MHATPRRYGSPILRLTRPTRKSPLSVAGGRQTRPFRRRRPGWERAVDAALGAAGMLILVRLWLWIFDLPWELTAWARLW